MNHNSAKIGFLGPILFTVAALALISAGSPPTLAFASARGTAIDAASPSTSTVTNLNPIVVRGHKAYVPAPVALQMVKVALKQPVSFNRENLNKLVCHVGRGGDLRNIVPKLICHTNCQLWIKHEVVQGVHVSNQLCASGYRSAAYAGTPGWRAIRVANWVNHHHINLASLRVLLKELPPIDGSYTLRITDHGQVVARYVFKNGNLVSVWKAKD